MRSSNAVDLFFERGQIQHVFKQLKLVMLPYSYIGENITVFNDCLNIGYTI